jgi:hypothetical protein
VATPLSLIGYQQERQQGDVTGDATQRSPTVPERALLHSFLCAWTA